jgi:hypothetical protein
MTLFNLQATLVEIHVSVSSGPLARLFSPQYSGSGAAMKHFALKVLPAMVIGAFALVSWRKLNLPSGKGDGEEERPINLRHTPDQPPPKERESAEDVERILSTGGSTAAGL